VRKHQKPNGVIPAVVMYVSSRQTHCNYQCT